MMLKYKCLQSLPYNCHSENTCVVSFTSFIFQLSRVSVADYDELLMNSVPSKSVSLIGSQSKLFGFSIWHQPEVHGRGRNPSSHTMASQMVCSLNTSIMWDVILQSSFVVAVCLLYRGIVGRARVWPRSANSAASLEDDDVKHHATSC